MTNQPKTAAEIELMRQSGHMVATVLELMVSQAKPGVSSRYLADLAVQELKSLGGQSAFLGVKSGRFGPPFPDVICISISEQVQHGVPSDRVLVEGDLVNFDFGVNYRGFITDAGLTVGVGSIGADGQRLLTGTQKALKAGLSKVRAGGSVSHISSAIERVLRQFDLGIVKELVGHGVGHNLHEEPEIPNYRFGGPDYILKENQTIAVEPIATLGSGQIRLAPDKWTILSADNTLAAHFEETVLVTRSGYEILTQRLD